jgi:Family of unknown function (DUF6941)
VKLDWMMFTNYAEVAPNGLLYCAGGGWDTINVTGRIEGAPENVFAVMQGFLAIRLLFHPTETDREHQFEVTIMDEDGARIAGVESRFRINRMPSLPAGWLQNLNIVLPVTGIPLPRAGNYVLNLNVNGQWMGDRPFRILKLYS